MFSCASIKVFYLLLFFIVYITLISSCVLFWCTWHFTSNSFAIMFLWSTHCTMVYFSHEEVSMKLINKSIVAMLYLLNSAYSGTPAPIFTKRRQRQAMYANPLSFYGPSEDQSSICTSNSSTGTEGGDWSGIQTLYRWEFALQMSQ